MLFKLVYETSSLKLSETSLDKQKTSLITVNTKAEPVVHISKLLERSSTDAKNLNQKRSECSNVVKNDFESSCLNDCSSFFL